MLKYEIKKLQLKHPWTISRGTSDYKENIFLTYEKDGIVGFGEAAPNTRYNQTVETCNALLEKAKPLFESSDPWQFFDLGQQIHGLDLEQSAAKAALDMCLLDWITKSLQIPFHKFLGLNKEKTPVTTYTIGLDTPEVIKQKVTEAEAFPVLKIKLGIENDTEVIEAVRSVTDKALRVDANEGWKNKEEALEKICWLQTQGVEFVEQPLPAHKLEETQWLRERIDIPLIADESVQKAEDIPKLASVFDGINIKLMKAGGLQEALRMIWLATALNMKIMLGCMVESSLAISAAAAISPLVDYADLDGNLLIKNDPFTGVQVKNGKLILNESPGLGATPR